MMEHNSNDPQVARTVLANERTFLAWARTSLALISAGVAVAKFLPLAGTTGLGKIAGVVLILLGTSALGVGYRGWATNQSRILTGMPLGRQIGPGLLAAGMAAVATVALLIALA